MLTNASVKAARARPRAYKIAGGQGLHLHVAPTGTKSFRLRFRWAGKEQLLTLGAWPEISLSDAREQADLARAELAEGRDPRARACRSRAEVETFERVGRRWIEQQRPRWSDVHAADVESSLVRDVFPAIGATPIARIDPPAVLELLRDVEQRGSIETARRIRQRISAVFSLAMAEDLVAADPAAIVRKALLPTTGKRQQPALLEVDQCRALLAAAELVDVGATIRLASRFLALTAVRFAAVRGARWSEIEDLDGAAALWRVPAARMKLVRAKKGDARHDHLVPLSAAAVEVLRAARAVTGGAAELAFPGNGADGMIGERAIGDLYARTPFAGQHVPHGWRASFSTILNERCPDDRLAIDRALAHSPKDKVEAAYNRAQQLHRRRELFETWGELLANGG